jgi:drug/metabolite transporter (DMT)-like permease
MTARTWLLFAAGEQYVSSSLTAILIASMPLMVALLSTRFSPADKPGGLRLAGLVIGFGGVVALLGVDVAGESRELLGVFVLDERLGVISVVGLLAILGGSWLSTGGRPPGLRPRGSGVGCSGRGWAAHRASSASTSTRHSRRARAWPASEARWARRSR